MMAHQKGDGDEGEDDDDEEDDDYDIYIMMQFCLFVTKNDHFLLGVSCNHLIFMVLGWFSWFFMVTGWFYMVLGWF